MINCSRLIISFLLTITFLGNSVAQEEPVAVDKLLVSDYFQLTPPLLKSASQNSQIVSSILKNSDFATDNIDPVTGSVGNIIFNSWKSAGLNSDGELILESSKENFREVYVSFYIVTETFLPLTLQIFSDAGFVLYVNDKKQLTSKDGIPDTIVKYSEELSLQRGTHCVIARFILAPGIENRTVRFATNTKEPFRQDLSIALKPLKHLTTKQLLDDTKISSISLSRSGKYAALSTVKYNNANKKNDNILMLFEPRLQKLIHTFVPSSAMSRLRWLETEPESFIYTESNGSETNIRQYTPATGENKIVFGSVTDIENYFPEPDGRKIYALKTVKSKEETKIYKKYNSPNDRWPWANSKNKLVLFDEATGTERIIVDLDNSLRINDLSPSGNKLLLSFGEDNLSTRPFSKTYSVEYNTQTGTLDTIMIFDWYRSAFYLNENEIIYSGGPSMFGQLGVNVPDSVIPNEYDTQLYLYNLSTQKAVPITKNFNPSVNNTEAAENGSLLRMIVTEGSTQPFYEYSISSGAFKKIPLSVEVMNDFAADAQGGMIYTGSGATEHEKVYYYQKGTSKVLYDPSPHLSNFLRGKVKDFDYTTQQNTTIDGLLYYPVNYDSTRQYPCIINYYGGTSPVQQDFEGRYPKNIWTANEYFVYVIQPSGATGYGQKFSASHVNDWGEITSAEIIGAVKNLLQNHPSISPQKLGCIGASYGGFMTMTLLTKTDLFTAAISHAGISLLSSYWGEGYWGYLYSAIATANSYPWNRKDIYVDRSPIYHADKVNTPLLLLHGNSDTNVPPGESMQFYTALKLLGKTVELVEMDKQDHHILEHDKRKFWTELIVSWFDRYLKNQAGHWEYLLKQK